MKKRKNYIFTNKRHSKRAVMSAVLGTISVLSLVAAVYLSYRKKGDVPGSYGAAALLAALFSLTGLILGLVTVREQNYYRLFLRLGFLLNLTALAGVGILLCLGIYAG